MGLSVWRIRKSGFWEGKEVNTRSKCYLCERLMRVWCRLCRLLLDRK